MIEILENKIAAWLDRRKRDRLVQKFGGIQSCPWCRNCVQEYPGWKFTTAADGNDLLHCACCRGTSLWRFEMGMTYLGPVDPPKPVNLLYMIATTCGEQKPEPSLPG